MRLIPYTFEGTVAVNATGLYSLFALDLSALTEDYLIIESTSVMFDLLNGDTSSRYCKSGFINDTGATVADYTVNYAESQYSFDQGDSRVNYLDYDQSTSVLRQYANVLVGGARDINFKVTIKVWAY